MRKRIIFKLAFAAAFDNQAEQNDCPDKGSRCYEGVLKELEQLWIYVVQQMYNRLHFSPPCESAGFFWFPENPQKKLV
jgi:hypothetical protein